ncbi:MAG TPA: hypothetical protein VFZ51_04535 [Woeseiaceae bacterium]
MAVLAGRNDAVIKLRLIVTAAFALLLGTSVYLLDRDWGSVLFLTAFADQQPGELSLFGSLGHTLPSFLHAYAFALLIIVVLWRLPGTRAWSAVGWMAVAGALECLQADRFGALFSEHESFLAELPLANVLNAYIVNGHFDDGDLVATALGCLTAYVVARIAEVSS